MTKIVKKSICVVAVFAMLVFAFPASGASAVFADSWYDSYVEHAESSGWIEPLSEGDFGALEPMTRAVFISALHELYMETLDSANSADGDAADIVGESENDSEKAENTCDDALYGGSGENSVTSAADNNSESAEGADDALYGGEEETGAMTAEEMFDDVNGDEWFADALDWAVSYEIINGIDGSFCADQTINRETMAVIIQRASYVIGMGYGSEWSYSIDYTDLEEISSWAVDGVAYCSISGIMSGNDDGTFAPKRTLTRAEGAAVLCRIEADIAQ